MSAFDGEIDYNSVYMVDYKKKNKPKSPRRNVVDDNCLIVGFGRDNLNPREKQQKQSDKLCPLDKEFYKDCVQRMEKSHPRLKKLFFEQDIDPVPIENDDQDRKRRTEYLVQYCPRDMPFMSVNLARRARALQTLRLPDDIEIPATTHTCDYRPPPSEKIVKPKTQSLRPTYDPTLQDELRRILRVRTGESSYALSVGQLGRMILEQNPYGPPREEPKYGKWRNPNQYNYQL